MNDWISEVAEKKTHLNKIMRIFKNSVGKSLKEAYFCNPFF